MLFHGSKNGVIIWKVFFVLRAIIFINHSEIVFFFDRENANKSKLEKLYRIKLCSYKKRLWFSAKYSANLFFRRSSWTWKRMNFIWSGQWWRKKYWNIIYKSIKYRIELFAWNEIKLNLFRIDRESGRGKKFTTRAGRTKSNESYCSFLFPDEVLEDLS